MGVREAFCFADQAKKGRPMTGFHRFVLATVSVASLAAAGAASAEVLQARSECVDGFWHVRTYDISDGREVLVKDEKTEQPCGASAAATTSEMRVWSSEGYRFQPKYELRPTLGYQYSRPQPQREMRISPRYSF
jgi:hypothetical protein